MIGQVRAVRGYQLFFPLGALFAAASVPVWVLRYLGLLPDRPAWPGANWHGHEMVFGYASAMLAGFLTLGGRGWRVWLLALLWAGARLLFAFDSSAPIMLAVALDLAFLPALLLLRQPPLWTGFKLMSLGIAGAILALTTANLLFHLADPTTAARFAWDGLVLLLIIVAGRLVPGHTRAATRRGVGLHLTGAEKAGIGVAVAMAAADLSSWSRAAGLLSAVLAVLQGYRLARWWDPAILRQPLLWGLHLGFAWLVLGLALRSAAELSFFAEPTGPQHALFVGAIGTLTLAIAMRTSLSQRQRPQQGGAIEAAIFGCIGAAAAARVTASLLAADWTGAAFGAAAACWATAFVLFLIAYGRLFAP
jgi:uncharacterized protein involved in response to NO